jgi:EmrB/QacA subfamily drug resistance transporter
MSRFLSIPYKWLVAIVFICGLFMDLLDTTIVNVALPTFGRHFGASNTTLEWVVTGYLLSLAVWIPASGWLGDRFGTKRIFLFAITMFTLGSVLCATSWSIESLIAFRVLQGVGGGMLTPVGTAMLYRAFTPYERAQASAVLMIPIAIAPTIGPILGGVLVDYASWHWIFLINLPIGILTFFLAAAALKEHTEENVGRFDVPGFFLSAAGLPLILFGLTQAPGKGWLSPWAIGPMLVGVVLMITLVIVELRATAPLLSLRLFGNRMFRNANMVNFIVSAGFSGAVFLLPLFLQELRGLSAFHSGLTTFPQALGLMVVSRFAAKLYPTMGPRKMATLGMIGGAITTIPFLFFDTGTSLWLIRAVMFSRGVTMGFGIIPINAAQFSTISRSDSGRASSLVSTNRQVASSVGVAVVATILADRTVSYLHSAGTGATQTAVVHAGVLGYRDAYIGVIILTLIGVLFASRIKDEDAAASMRAPAAPPVETATEPSHEPAFAH